MLTAYFDESYDGRTMCIGGWIARDEVWTRIDAKWKQRIDYENRISARKGTGSLSRYHASDCASMCKEFEGWDEPRQISLTKRLIAVIGEGNRKRIGSQPIGVACGLSLLELHNVFPLIERTALKWQAYRVCMVKALLLTGQVMRRNFTNERVTVIYDRTKEFNSAAQMAYADALPEDNPMAKYFVSIAPGGWEDFVALQSADFLAFEGFKLTGSCKRGKEHFRLSLQGIVGKHVPLAVGFFTEDNLRELTAFGVSLGV